MRIQWLPAGISQGVDRGVLYLPDGTPKPWLGLVNVVESVEDTIQTDLYYDGVRFGFGQSGEDYSVAMEAWTYPDELDSMAHWPFGLSWREDNLLHMVWNAVAAPIEKPYSSKNNEMELSRFNWAFVTHPQAISGIKPTAHLVVDTNLAPVGTIVALEDLLYGTASTTGTLPSAQGILDFFLAHAIFVVTDNGDGTVHVSGPDDAVYMTGANTVTLKWPSVIQTDPNTYHISTF